MNGYDSEFCRAVLSASLDTSKPNKGLAKQLLKKKNDITPDEIRFLAALFLGKLSPEKTVGRPKEKIYSTQIMLDTVALIKRYQYERRGKKDEIIDIVIREKNLMVEMHTIKNWITEINDKVFRCYEVVSQNPEPIKTLSKMFDWPEKQIEKVIKRKTPKKS